VTTANASVPAEATKSAKSSPGLAFFMQALDINARGAADHNQSSHIHVDWPVLRFHGVGVLFAGMDGR
jgi:hypothetical protein